jgi:Ribbon-helix-helix protein, copG family
MNKEDNPEERRLNVKFSPAAYGELQAMAKRRGKTVSEAVRDALSLDLWLEDQMRAGYSLQLRNPKGETMIVARPTRRP